MSSQETQVSSVEWHYGYSLEPIDSGTQNPESSTVRIDVAPGGSTEMVLIVNPETKLSLDVVSGHGTLEVSNLFDTDDESGEPNRIEVGADSEPTTIGFGTAYRWINLDSEEHLVVVDTAEPAFQESDELPLAVSPEEFFMKTGNVALSKFGQRRGSSAELEIPKQSTNAAIIDWEIESGIIDRDTGYANAFRFLNNFADSMPGGIRQQMIEGYDDDFRNEPFLGCDPELVVGAHRELCSPRVLSGESNEEFFNSVARAITVEVKEGNFCTVKLGELQAAYKDSRKDSKVNSNLFREELLIYLLPVYRRLRLMGYSHFDLTR